MTLRRPSSSWIAVSSLGALAVAGSLAGCKEPEKKPVQAQAVVDAGAAEKPAEEPLVELPPAPALPAKLAGLADLRDSTDNPMTPEKVQLGRMLFYEPRMAKDESMACISCHPTDHGWASAAAKDAKVGGAMNKRNTPSVVNLGFHNFFYWDGRVDKLEGVALAAWKGQLGADPAEIAKRLNAIPVYRSHFQRAFKANATPENIPQALAAFFRALQGGNAPFDRFQAGDKKAISKDAQAGFAAFKKAGCAACHVPPLFSDLMFHNVGIGSDLPEGERDKGRMDATKDEADEGKFKTPALRDVAKTAPYFHDGSAKTLDEAIAVMAAGGKKNPKLDPLLKPAKLSKKELASLKAFLESLSGETTFAQPPELP